MESTLTSNRRAERGFTLLEMSMVLIAIALIIGATTIGTNLQRNATFQKIATDFVRGWQLSYLTYFNTIGVVAGDNSLAPTGMVNAAANNLLCDNAPALGSNSLRGVMYAGGVKMPVGRAEGFEDRYSYLDSNGNPQELQVCFENVPWTVPGATAGTYVQQQKNVMVIYRLTPDLARMLDSMVDGVADAQFGDFRQSTIAANTTPVSTEWSKDNRFDYTSVTPLVPAIDEAQVGVVTAYYLMNP